MDSPFVEIIKHTDISPRNIAEPLDELLGKLSPDERSLFEKECIGNAMLAIFRVLRFINGADQQGILPEDRLNALKGLHTADRCVEGAAACRGAPYKVSCNALDAVYHAALADGYAHALSSEKCQEKASLALFEEREFQYKLVNELKSGGAG